MNSRNLILAAIILLAAACTLQTGKTLQIGKTIYLKDYLDGTDTEIAIRRALEDCAQNGITTLVLPGDTLRIRPDFCYGKYQIISNNAPSDKRIAFELDGLKNLTIEGNGTLLLFSGYVSPFDIQNCSNINIRNLSIDFTRTFTSESIITGAGDGWLNLRFPPDYITEIRNGILIFKDSDGLEYPYLNLLEFDTEKREVAHYVHDIWIGNTGVQAERMNNGDTRIFVNGIRGTVGNTMVFGATERLCPAFTLDRCEGFSLKNVNIWHCCGMGVIAQRSSDIELNRVNVVPAPGSGRMISISADATHFINCKGYIKMIDCDFRNQKDDATNIHGWYAVAKKKVSDNQLILWYNYGVDFVCEGMQTEFVSHRTMMTYDTLKVKAVNQFNNDYALVTFDENIPEGFEENDALADALANTAEVLIKGCYIGNNRARGVLIGSKGKVIIENNTFHSPGTAILFEGDGNYWFEQSGVKEVIIRNNLFHNCLYGCNSWGPAYISVGSGIPQRSDSRYHSNITVEGNTFDTFDPRILNLYCVDGICYRNNKLIMNNDYEFGRPGESFITSECDNIDITE